MSNHVLMPTFSYQTTLKKRSTACQEKISHSLPWRLSRNEGLIFLQVGWPIAYLLTIYYCWAASPNYSIGQGWGITWLLCSFSINKQSFWKDNYISWGDHMARHKKIERKRELDRRRRRRKKRKKLRAKGLLPPAEESQKKASAKDWA